VPPRLLAVAAIALLTAAASWWFIARTPGVQCDSLAPLTVLATVSAFVISICFRLMARHPARAARLFLLACLLLAAATLFTDFRFVRANRGFCGQLRRQMSSPSGIR
jgi:hypothetical protein